MIKTDLTSLQEHPEKYKGKWVIVTTELKSLVNNPKNYQGKNIEVTGLVKLESFDFRRINGWSFILKDKEGNSVRCYEQEYRVESWTIPELVLRRAEKEKKPVTVVGKFEGSQRIELDWMEYEGQHYDTDYKPPNIQFSIF
ncbi:MAG: OB-fold putative lipoprotein [Desulfobacterota bacterium]|nr:OB-fold putative lipoprotein [Thermodesulfobacteriota bacterium]